MSIFCPLQKKKKIRGIPEGSWDKYRFRSQNFCVLFSFSVISSLKCNSRNYWTSSESVSAKWEKSVSPLLSTHKQIYPILSMQIVGDRRFFPLQILVMKVPLDCPASLLHPYTYFTAHTMLEIGWAVNNVFLKLWQCWHLLEIGRASGRERV